MRQLLIACLAVFLTACADESNYYDSIPPKLTQDSLPTVDTPKIEVSTFNGQQVIIIPGGVVWDKAESSPKTVTITINVKPDNSVTWKVTTSGSSH